VTTTGDGALALERAIVRCDPQRLAELYELRARVWIEEGADPSAFPGGTWSDPLDAHRHHWVVLDDDRIVAGASTSFHASLAEVQEPEAYTVIPTPSPGIIAAPARVVVDAAFRGQGIATALLDCQDQAARAVGAVLAVRQASPAMRRILERRGWRDDGPGPSDPRFPGTRFTVMSLVLEEPS
jgi:GNAT superfamily N-acetyltransferase